MKTATHDQYTCRILRWLRLPGARHIPITSEAAKAITKACLGAQLGDGWYLAPGIYAYQDATRNKRVWLIEARDTRVLPSRVTYFLRVGAQKLN